MRYFPDPATWPQDDLIGWSDGITPEIALAAYGEGVFPMPIAEAGVIGWWSPLDRGVLVPGDLKVARSLRKTAKRYRCTVDADFPAVLERCGDPSRPDGWIDDDVRAVYLQLHAQGDVHSVEVWDAQERLVGGLYGVARGGLFAGESMFHDPEHGRDASKAALIHLVGVLSDGDRDGWLIDTQWLTDHLATLGVREIPREEYLARVAEVAALPDAAWASARHTTHENEESHA